MTLLDKAIVTAVNAHTGQVDKLGKPYIFHPISVMLEVHTEEEQILAVLHDVIENTNITLKDLNWLPKNVLTALDSLTKKKGQSNLEYIIAVKENTLARKVKYYDVIHNYNRLNELESTDPITTKRLRKKYTVYAEALGPKWIILKEQIKEIIEDI